MINIFNTVVVGRTPRTFVDEKALTNWFKERGIYATFDTDKDTRDPYAPTTYELIINLNQVVSPKRLKDIYRDMLKLKVFYDTEILEDEETRHITLICRRFNEWVVE